MLHLERGDGDAFHFERLLLLIFDEGQLEASLAFGDARIKCLCGGEKAGLDALGSGDNERTRPLAHILRVNQEPRQAAEMVAMQMADEYRVDVAWVEPKPAHADQRRRAAIDEKGGCFRAHM